MPNHHEADCVIAREVSAKLAAWQRQQHAVGEESLTDWLLFELSNRFPWVRYMKFTRHREARETGADWEWWLAFSDGAMGLRVQAKRLSAADDNYSGIAYTNQYGLQIEKLRLDARANGLLAFYALYHPETVELVFCAAAAQQPGQTRARFWLRRRDCIASLCSPLAAA